MQELSAPLWTADLLYAKQARAAWLERLSAFDEFKLSSVERLDWGYGLKLNHSPRFKAWWAKSQLEHLWRLDARELDDYRNTLLVSAEPAPASACPPAVAPKDLGELGRAAFGTGVRAALCSWSDLPRAAEYLRCGSGRTPDYSLGIQQILIALRIAEAPLNSSQFPNYCTTKAGPVLRLDEDTMREAQHYLSVAQPDDCSVPLLVNLAPGFAGIFAWGSFPQESLRIGLCGPWGVDLAMREATRWLKSQTPTPRKRATAAAKGDQ